MARKKQTTKWYARGGGIARCGPFKTQAEATASLRLVQRLSPDGRPAAQDEFPPDAFVWPEVG